MAITGRQFRPHHKHKHHLSYGGYSHLSIEELEMLASLNLRNNNDAHEWQKQWLRKLAHHFHHGKHTARDRRKAAKYRHKLGLERHPPKSKLLRPRHAISTLNWTNSIRLFLVRLNRFLSYFDAAFLSHPIVKYIASVAGLFFAFELAVHIGIIIKAVFFHSLAPHEHNMSRWERIRTRFKHIMLKDDRISAMVNAACSFAINFTAFVLTLTLTGPFALIIIAAVSFGSPVFDLGLELAKTGYSFSKLLGLAKKTKHEIAALQAKLDALTPEDEKQNPAAQEEIENKIAALQEVRTQLKQKFRQLKRFRYEAIAVAVVMLIAAAIIFFPPAGVPLAAIIAAAAALVVGSIFYGFGRRLYNKAESKGWIKKATDWIKDTWSRLTHCQQKSSNIHAASAESESESSLSASVLGSDCESSESEYSENESSDSIDKPTLTRRHSSPALAEVGSTQQMIQAMPKTASTTHSEDIVSAISKKTPRNRSASWPRTFVEPIKPIEQHHSDDLSTTETASLSV